jgi:thiol-disulfide isomerase/thioredoxin
MTRSLSLILLSTIVVLLGGLYYFIDYNDFFKKNSSLRKFPDSVEVLSSPSNFSNGQFYDREGVIHSFSSYKGQWILVNYWASWCQPCLQELPELDQLSKKYSIKIIAISIDNKGWSAIDNVLHKLRLTHLDIFLDTQQKINSLPITYLINPNGNEVLHVSKPISWINVDLNEWINHQY